MKATKATGKVRTVFLDLLDLADAVMYNLEVCPVCDARVDLKRGSDDHDGMCPVHRWRRRDDSTCDCEYTAPYGFVVHSGCDVHDDDGE